LHDNPYEGNAPAAGVSSATRWTGKNADSARDVPSRAALVRAGSAARAVRAWPAWTERAGTNAGTSRFGAAGGGTRRFIGVPTNDLAVHAVHEERGLCHNLLLFWIIYQRIAPNSVEMIDSSK
jgi:hypothetical protein